MGSATGYQYSDQQLNQGWGANFLGPLLSPSSYRVAANVTQPQWVQTVTTVATYTSAAAFTVATAGMYVGALGVGAGLATYGAVGAVGAGVGAGISYARGGSALSGAVTGWEVSTMIGSLWPEGAAMALRTGGRALGRGLGVAGAAENVGLTADFMPAGVRGGRVVSSAQMGAFKAKLDRLGIDVFDNVGNNSWIYDITGNRGGAVFTPTGIYERAAIVLPENATVNQLTHEWIHAMDYLKNPANYATRAGGAVLREQIVFDRLIQPGAWKQMNQLERATAIANVQKIGGNARGMVP